MTPRKSPNAARQATLGVIIPAFNEEATIAEVLERVLAQSCVHQVVVVDDGSTDGTLDGVRRFQTDGRVTVEQQPRNRGKGAAIRTALALVRTPIVLVQ